MRKKVIVVGGGFAGLQMVRLLDEEIFDILLLDKLNHHQFQPLFYQVATSQIEPASISFPLRNIFKDKKNVQVRLAEVTAIDREKKMVTTDIGDFEYDYLVIAIGCRTNFFGNVNIRNNAYSLKTTYDAITLRNHVLKNFEAAISAKEEDKQCFLNLVIVGGGPTGVELAGAFAEIKKHILPKDYHGIDFSKFRIILVEGSPNTLNNMSEKTKVTSAKYLKKMGVELKMSTFVKDYDGKVLTFNTGEQLTTRTVIWAAGVRGRLMEGILPEEVAPHGKRLLVNRINQLENAPDIFAVGDIACMITPKYPRGHPQLANVAITQAKLLAKNMKRIELGKPTKKFEYLDLGSMATVGTNKALVDFPKIHFKGLVAWFIWMFLHLMLILSVRNKLIIFINWAWAYITKDTSLRLILTRPDDREA
ncbi:MAG TPA: NAD(P)/FAD-dependent oxidoreductase [Bacteroidales bacterium]|nr:NAD(P)/FAD-dependent oxidoreductase [Bacteroidales bacterium]